jgi:hypothetical protein
VLEIVVLVTLGAMAFAGLGAYWGVVGLWMLVDWIVRRLG